jgi:phosphate transport system protein
MSKHLDREIERLRRKILALSAIVEEAVNKAVASVAERDLETAAGVIAADRTIDEAEIEVEEECLKALALHQPVANDLRYIVAVLKLNNDLERIADLAVNIAAQVGPLVAEGCVPYPVDVMPMARRTQAMLRHALDALVELDCDAAEAVCAADDEVDAMHREVYASVKSLVRSQPEHAAALIHLLSVSRYLERIADLATNIAEDIIYTMKGEIVRHGHGRRS